MNYPSKKQVSFSQASSGYCRNCRNKDDQHTDEGACLFSPTKYEMLPLQEYLAELIRESGFQPPPQEYYGKFPAPEPEAPTEYKTYYTSTTGTATVPSDIWHLMTSDGTGGFR